MINAEIILGYGEGTIQLVAFPASLLAELVCELSKLHKTIRIDTLNYQDCVVRET